MDGVAHNYNGENGHGPGLRGEKKVGSGDLFGETCLSVAYFVGLLKIGDVVVLGWVLVHGP